MAALRAELGGAARDSIAGIMITNPNTLGLFDRNIEAIADAVHEAGGLVYGDGANMNALAGVLKPAEVGIDVMHYNLHKTFSTPHGGGGPGAGFVGVRPDLADFLPGPIAVKAGDSYGLAMPKRSIGRMKAFYGNSGYWSEPIPICACSALRGCAASAETAVLNANYIKALVDGAYKIKYPRRCMHEFVAQGDLAGGRAYPRRRQAAHRLRVPPAHIYFPLIVPEALMIEPTETEAKETLDEFAAVLLKIAEEAREEPSLLVSAPTTTPVGRLDEVSAARNPTLCYRG